VKKIDFFLFFVLGLAVVILTALPQESTGYMDADYYLAGGIQLAKGNGFSDPFIWNFLDNPADIPHPSHTYWMPLPSILSALGILILPFNSNLSSRLLFVFLAGIIPPLTAWLSFILTHDKHKARLSGWLAAFGGFFAIYISLPETFALYMVLGCLFVIFLFFRGKRWFSTPLCWERFLLLGVLAGLLHLTRADGILWCFAGFGAAVWFFFSKVLSKPHFSRLILCFICVGFGYTLITLPWFIRNLQIMGSLFPPGNAHTLWLTNYDETFTYPADRINVVNWIHSGLAEIISVRWKALLNNLATFIAVEGEVFLFPLLIVGFWRMRKDGRIIFAFIMWIIIFGVMTIVFPFAGSRGGLFHSSSSLQPVFWAVAPLGLESFINLGVKWRQWNLPRANKVFGFGLVVVAILFTVVIYMIRVIGANWSTPVWSSSSRHYREVESILITWGAGETERVMVNNPPGYYLESNRQALVIPDGDLNTTFLVANRYKVDYLILEKNHVKGLDTLFSHPVNQPGLNYLGSVGDTLIFKFVEEP
jgi:hypothetical protein